VKLNVTTAGHIDINKGHRSDVVLIHGTGSGAEMWKPQVEMLVGKGYRCFVPDLRGHGLTADPGEPTDIEDHLKDIEDTLGSLDIEYPAIFIGHSLGAIISLTLAERKPELFQQVFAVGMPGKVLPPVSIAFRLFLNAPFEKLRGTTFHERLPWRPRTMISTHRNALTQIVDNFDALDFVSRGLEVVCPVHFAVGRWDPVAPHYFVEKMHRALPGSTLHVFEWAGHNMMDQYPQQFNDWLSRYLKDHKLPRP
jgi:pimeloyl-ACP methyl ester carboxylesterase